MFQRPCRSVLLYRLSVLLPPATTGVKYYDPNAQFGGLSKRVAWGTRGLDPGFPWFRNRRLKNYQHPVP